MADVDSAFVAMVHVGFATAAVARVESLFVVVIEDDCVIAEAVNDFESVVVVWMVVEGVMEVFVVTIVVGMEEIAMKVVGSLEVVMEV